MSASSSNTISGFMRGLHASTSRSVAHPRINARSFSTSRVSAAGREKVLIELMQDIPSLGQVGDRVKVVPGFARLNLVPSRKARFVPFAEKFGIEPYKAPLRSTHNRKTKKAAFTPSGIAALETPPELLEKLRALPPYLDFQLATIDSNSSALLQTFTLAEIQEELATPKYGLGPDEVILKWADGGSDRIERIGERELMVVVKGKGMEERRVTVNVARTFKAAQSFLDAHLEARGSRTEGQGKVDAN